MALTMCNPLGTISGVYDPFCMPFIDAELEPPLITGVSCCHVEACELELGWSGCAGCCCCCCCCCAWDVSGGGEFTGVDGFELKLLML